MDLTMLAVDAGQLINRAVQYSTESLGHADRTELDPVLEKLLARADVTKTWTDSIISQTEVLLQPSLGARLEDRLYEHLEWSVPPRPRANELLGEQMTQAGLEIGSNTPYGTALIRCGEAQKQFGDAERKFVKSTNIHFLTPLRSFTEGEYRVIQNERKMLVNKRLDLDIAKSRLRNAREADREARCLNSSPLDDDYLSHVSYMFSFLRVKWLKIWAQEISQAEMELRICQSLFDRQSETTRRLVDGIDSTHTNHMRSLVDFVEAQSSYFAQCSQHAQELQRQLTRIPAILCSNNWQSAAENEVNLPTTSSPVADDQVTPTLKEVLQLQDFNQDSQTVGSPPKAEADSSLSAPQPGNANINNNNIFSAQSEANGDQSAGRRRLFASQTFDRVSKLNRGDDHEAPDRTGSVCVTTNRAFAAASGAAEAVGVSVHDPAGGAGGGGGGTKAASSPSQAEAISNESRMANSETSEATTPTGEGVRGVF